MTTTQTCCIEGCTSPICMSGYAVCKKHREQMEEDDHIFSKQPYQDQPKRLDEQLYSMTLERNAKIASLEHKIRILEAENSQLKRQLYHQQAIVENQMPPAPTLRPLLPPQLPNLSVLKQHLSPRSPSPSISSIDDETDILSEPLPTTGSCKWCHQHDANPGKTLCTACFVIHRKNAAEKNAQHLIPNGICTWCKKNQVNPGKTLCQMCFSAHMKQRIEMTNPLQ